MKKIFTIFAALFISGFLFGQTINVDVSQGCAPLKVHFSCVTTLPSVKYYNWVVDGNYEYKETLSKDTSITFTDKGYHYVDVDLFDQNGSNIGYAYTYVTVNGLTSISYPKKVCPGDMVTIDYNGQVNSMNFDFGDGSPISTKNSHTYSKAGKYSITAIGKSSCGNDTIKDTIRIAENLKMTGYFDVYVYPNNVCPTEPISYNIYSNNNSPFTIDFGDGTPVVNSYTRHSYTTYGIYTLSAKFTNGCGSDTTLKETITVSKNTPWDQFLSIYKQKDKSCPNEPINFDLTSNVAGVAWDFGDGGTAIGVSTNHIFTSTGKFYITAKVTNYCGKDTLLKDSVQIIGNLPISITDEGVVPDNICPNSSADFYFGSSSVISQTWYFGDKDTSNAPQTSHAYTNLGNYPVTLILRNGCGSDTTFNYTVHVIDHPASVNGMSLSTNKACPGDEVSIEGSSVEAASYLINFGDGYFTNNYGSHKYLKSGTYPVKIEVTNYCGNKASRVDTIRIIDNYSIFGQNNAYVDVYPSSICPGDPVDYYTNNTASILWDFGNGQKSNSSQGLTSFSSTGTYNYTLTLANGCGVDTTLKGSIIVGDALSKTTYSDIYPSITCTGSAINFYVSNNTQKVLWNFGDSTSSTQLKGIHSYKKAGIYYAKATTTNGCNISTTDSTKVTISDALQLVVPQINKTPKNPCPGDEVQFAILYNYDYYDLPMCDQNVDNYNLTWQFADGNLRQDSAFKTFSVAGKYPFVLKINNASGKEIDVKDTIVVGASGENQKLITLLGDAEKSPSDSAYFGFSANVKSREVDFGDGSKASIFKIINDNGQMFYIVSHKYATSGEYTVKLNIVNNCGEAASDSMAIAIDNYTNSSYPFYSGYTVNQNQQYCIGEKVNFTLYDLPNVKIDFGDGVQNTYLQSAFSTISHSYKTSGTYSVSIKSFNATANTDTIVYSPFTINVDTCHSISDKVETIAKGTMHVYPNPVKDRLIIEYTEETLKQENRYILYDLKGRIILEGTLNKESTSAEINMSSVPTGLYLLRVISNDDTSVIKVIKE